MMKLNGVNLSQWIEENRHLLKPPVGNKVMWQENGVLIMVVGGPNSRTDFHYNETEEIFYQVEGQITLDVVENGIMKHIPISEGEFFILPAKVPHRPVRGANTIGVVIELSRQPAMQDGLMWFCEHCHELLFEEYFVLRNIEKDFQPIFKKFNDSVELRTCKNCQQVHSLQLQ